MTWSDWIGCVSVLLWDSWACHLIFFNCLVICSVYPDDLSCLAYQSILAVCPGWSHPADLPCWIWWLGLIELVDLLWICISILDGVVFYYVTHEHAMCLFQLGLVCLFQLRLCGQSSRWYYHVWLYLCFGYGRHAMLAFATILAYTRDDTVWFYAGQSVWPVSV